MAPYLAGAWEHHCIALAGGQSHFPKHGGSRPSLRISTRLAPGPVGTPGVPFRGGARAAVYFPLSPSPHAVLIQELQELGEVLGQGL